jgi:DNA-binding IscR family transcriptional regulator
VPEETIGYIVNALCRRHVLREINDPPGLVLARPLAQVTLANLVEAVRVQDLALGDWHISIDSAVDRMAGEVDSAIVQTLATRTLHDLVEAAAPDVTAPAP